MPLLPFDDDPDSDTGIAPWPAGAPEVTETENPVIARLYGPDGAIFAEVRERRTVPFGYRA